jgi:beta-glucosidase
MIRIATAALASLLALAPTGAGAADDALRLPPRDPAIEARIADLVARMTLEEKVGQMFMEACPDDKVGSRLEEGAFGALLNCAKGEVMADAQARARKTRLGIPLLFGRDVIHGYRTLFPVPLGLAASFDPEVWTTAAEMTAREGAGDGLNLAFGPMVDVSRDGRWGRVVEGPGEDPWLAARFAADQVRGQHHGGIGSALKHFVGYGAARAGRDYAEADISNATLGDVYLPPFRAGLENGAEVIMAAFGALNGVPGTANHRTLTDLLKVRWGFDGFVLSDWDAIRELLKHGLAADTEDAVAMAVNAGLDMEIAGLLIPEHLPGLVRSGRVSQARIDDAVTRILRVKFRMGLFDTAPLPGTAAPIPLAAPEIRDAARDAARRSVVLLKNDGDLLPLVKPPERIVVVGRAAMDPSDHMGAWGAQADQKDTPLFAEELRRRLAPHGTRVVYSMGCDDDCLEPDKDEFDDAVAAAKHADLIVAMLGEPWYMTAESTSRTKLGLPNHQQELLDRLAATKRPLLLITLAGRPMVMTEAMPKARAVFYAYSPGTMTAPALVDLILGEASPSARLPMSLPRAVGQLPYSYDALPTGRPVPDSKSDDLWARYIDEEITPLFPFGYGLSYTKFAYGDLRLSAARLGRKDTLTAEVAVTNTGKRRGREIVQLYVHDVVAARSRPMRQLKGLGRVDLAPGETRRVKIEVPVAELGYHDDDGGYVVEPGRFEVFVGGSSLADLTADFEVTAD